MTTIQILAQLSPSLSAGVIALGVMALAALYSAVQFLFGGRKPRHQRHQGE